MCLEHLYAFFSKSVPIYSKLKKKQHNYMASLDALLRVGYPGYTKMIQYKLCSWPNNKNSSNLLTRNSLFHKFYIFMRIAL